MILLMLTWKPKYQVKTIPFNDGSCVTLLDDEGHWEEKDLAEKKCESCWTNDWSICQLGPGKRVVRCDMCVRQAGETERH